MNRHPRTPGTASLVAAGYSVSIAQFTFLGEVALIFWLLIKGVEVSTA
jgi:hypothetical protein